MSGVEYGVRNDQTGYRYAADDVGVDDLVHVLGFDASIPNCFGVDDEIWTVLALIETARLVGPYFAFEAAFREFLFE